MTPRGRLFLLPAPIGEGDPRHVLSPEVIETFRSLRHFVVESERSAERLLSRILEPSALEGIELRVLNEHTDPRTVPYLLKPALEGRDMGILSEAGCPCVADPGADLVAEAHRRGVQVLPLPGPSSILQALMASGFSGQRFHFLGYLPAKPEERRAALARLDREAARDGGTRIFIETPYRNNAVLTDALEALHPDTRFCAALGLGGSAEHVYSMDIRAWRTAGIRLGKEPAVFLLAPKADRRTLTGRPSDAAAPPPAYRETSQKSGRRGSLRASRGDSRRPKETPGA